LFRNAFIVNTVEGRKKTVGGKFKRKVAANSVCVRGRGRGRVLAEIGR
jgi:hypothetical protein